MSTYNIYFMTKGKKKKKCLKHLLIQSYDHVLDIYILHTYDYLICAV